MVFMETHTFSQIPPEAAWLAYQQLWRLNLEAHKPAVAEWLHSEEALPALRELLVVVPCAGSVH